MEATIVLKTPYLVDLDISYDDSLERRRIFRPAITARERLIDMGYDGIVLMEGGYVEVVAYDAPSLSDLDRGPIVASLASRPAVTSAPRP